MNAPRNAAPVSLSMTVSAAQPVICGIPGNRPEAMAVRKNDKPVIVLDVGRVLVDFDLKPWIGALSKNRGEKVTLPPLSAIDKLFLPVQTGEASLDDIVPELNASLGVSMASSEWHALSCSIFTGEMPGMKQMLRELKNDFFLVALTNTIEVHWTFLLKTYEILKLMDGCIVSYLEGVAKPDPAIYQAVVDRYCDGGLPYFHTDDLPSMWRQLEEWAGGPRCSRVRFSSRTQSWKTHEGMRNRSRLQKPRPDSQSVLTGVFSLPHRGRRHRTTTTTLMRIETSSTS